MIQPKVFLIGSPPIVGEGNSLPWGHMWVRSVDECDVVFVWLSEHDICAYSSMQLGRALAIGKPLIVGHSNWDHVTRDSIALGYRNFLKNFSHRLEHGKDALDAYERAMADIDVRPPEVYEQVKSDVPGICTACGSHYSIGNIIYRQRLVPHLAQHSDCYERRKNPASANPALFHAGLTEALRKDNARLEAELEELRAVTRR